VLDLLLVLWPCAATLLAVAELAGWLGRGD